jgi:hypothetical protein
MEIETFIEWNFSNSTTNMESALLWEVNSVETLQN